LPRLQFLAGSVAKRVVQHLDLVKVEAKAFVVE
jgi:hypothetical protein